MASHNDSRRNSHKDRKKDDIEDQLVVINRITRVVKGDRRTRFAVVVIVGDRKGHIGFGTGRAQEVPETIRKAVGAGKKGMIKVLTVGATIPHGVMDHHDSSNIMLKPVGAGSGVVAGDAIRIVMDLAGISGTTSRSLGPNTPINVIRATMDGLSKLKTREDVLKLRESAKSLED